MKSAGWPKETEKKTGETGGELVKRRRGRMKSTKKKEKSIHFDKKTIYYMLLITYVCPFCI